jgi:hypothetical protein
MKFQPLLLPKAQAFNSPAATGNQEASDVILM